MFANLDLLGTYQYLSLSLVNFLISFPAIFGSISCLTLVVDAAVTVFVLLVDPPTPDFLVNDKWWGLILCVDNNSRSLVLLVRDTSFNLVAVDNWVSR